MNKFDFKQLKTLTAPEAWIETALHIPNRKNKPLPFLLRPSFIGSAAALFVVVTVLLTLRLSFGTPQPPAVNSVLFASAPSEPSATEATAPTQPPKAAETTVSGSQPSVTAAPYDSAAVPEKSTEATASPAIAAVTAAPPAAKPVLTETQPLTEPYLPSATEALTEPYLPPVTEALTEPYLPPATEALTTPCIEEGDNPTVPQPVTAPERTGEPFYGSLQFRIIDSSPFFSSNSIRVSFFYDNGAPVCTPKSFRPALTEEGVKNAVLQPYLQNITLTCGEVYTMEITGSKGVSASRALVVQDVNPLIVYI